MLPPPSHRPAPDSHRRGGPGSRGLLAPKRRRERGDGGSCWNSKSTFHAPSEGAWMCGHDSARPGAACAPGPGLPRFAGRRPPAGAGRGGRGARASGRAGLTALGSRRRSSGRPGLGPRSRPSPGRTRAQSGPRFTVSGLASPRRCCCFRKQNQEGGTASPRERGAAGLGSGSRQGTRDK